MSITVPLADIDGKRGMWLLDFNVGGLPFRFAESRVVVLTEDGEQLQYSEGLGELELSVVQDAEPTQRVTISSSVDWALLVAQGNPLDLGRATLRRFFTGQTFERTRVQLRGDIESPGYDKKGADLVFTIAERPNRLADPIIRPHGRIDEDTFPISGGMFHIDEKSGDSRPYPTVFGYPGQLPNKVVPAVPVPVCEARNNNSATRVVLTRGEADASDVDLWKLNDGVDTDTRPVSLVRDLLNVQLSTATVGNSLSQMQDGGIYYAGFSFANGGGVLRPDRSGPLRGAGEITRFIMNRFIRRVGLDSRFDAVQDILDQWKIDTYVDGEDVSWWEFLTNELWPLLPVVQVRGPDGIYLEVIDFAAEERDTRFELNADRRAVTRVPGVETVGGEDIANEITLKYAPRRDSGKFHKELTVSGDAGFLQTRQFLEPSSRRVLSNVFCRRSQDLYGATRRDIRTTHMIWDRATAGLSLNWWAARDGIPRRRLRYRGGHGLESVPPWKPIVIRDSELHLDGAIGWLEDIIAGPAGDEAIVIIQDHPHIGTRATT